MALEGLEDPELGDMIRLRDMSKTRNLGSLGGPGGICRLAGIGVPGGIWRFGGSGGPESKCIFGNIGGTSCIGYSGRSVGSCILSLSLWGSEDSVTGTGL